MTKLDKIRTYLENNKNTYYTNEIISKATNMSLNTIRYQMFMLRDILKIHKLSHKPPLLCWPKLENKKAALRKVITDLDLTDKETATKYAHLLLLDYFLDNPEASFLEMQTKLNAMKHIKEKFKINVEIKKLTLARMRLINNEDITLEKGKLHLAKHWIK